MSVNLETLLGKMEVSERPPSKKTIRSPLSPIGAAARAIEIQTNQIEIDNIRSIKSYVKSPSPKGDISFTPPQLLNPKQLAEFYQCAFLASPATQGDLLVLEMVFKIEKLFSDSKIEAAIIMHTKELIKKLFANKSTLEVFAELGVIYFYLDKNGHLPSSDGCFEYRLKEIEEEIRRLKNSKSNSLSTGVLTYLLRAFSTMMIDSEGKVNKGGIAAVNQLLNGRLAFFFKEDHRDHIVAVLTHLLEDADFVTMLEQPISVHKKMEIFICIDLKLPFGSELSVQATKIACLLALFSDRRQILANCFAVAPFVYTCRNKPHLLLNAYIQLLQEGFLELTEGVKLSVFDLFSKRVVDEEELDRSILVEDVKLNAAFYSAIVAIGLNLNAFDDYSQTQSTLRELIIHASQKTAHPEGAYFMASSIIGSFKMNALQEMLICFLEFQEANVAMTGKVSSSNDKIRPIKGSLINFIQEQVDSYKSAHPLMAQTQDIQQFLMLFMQIAEDRLWLQDHVGKLQCEEEGPLFMRIAKTWIEIEKFNKDDFDELKTSMTQFRRVICIKNDKLITIDTVPALNCLFEEWIDEIAQNPDFTDFLMHHNSFITNYKSYLTKALSDSCPKFLYKINGKAIPLSLEHYEASKIFLFDSDGGLTLSTCKRLRVPCQRRMTTSQNMVDNFLEILKHFSALPDKKTWRASQKLALCTSIHHTFLLQPHTFWPLIEQDPLNILQKKSIAPMDRLLEAPLSFEKIKKIINVVIKDPNIKDIYLNFFTDPVTANQFLDKMQVSVGPDVYKRILFELEKEITKITCATIAWEEVINTLFPTMDSIQQKQISTQLVEFFSKFEELNALDLSYGLQKMLITFGKFRARITLEMVICSKYDRPMNWVLGDFNYSQLVESPEHQLLILKMLPRGLQIFTRKGLEESPLGARFLTDLAGLVEVFY